MGSLGSPKSLVPFLNSKDCSQGFCSLYCPQWCYIIHPPPPPLDFPDDNNSSPNFSPLVVAIIGIIVSAFLLVSYYALISKYCGNNTDQRGRSTAEDGHNHSDDDLDDNHNPSIHEAWHVATSGLDEALIKSITVCKYKRGEGLVEGTDCSVCLSEFLEDESVRLLPKCSHAFHIQCIDTWLRSHSNCPLCRANVVCVNPPPPPPTTTTESFSSHESTPANDQTGQDRNSESVEENNGQHINISTDHVIVPKTNSTTTTTTTTSSLRAFSDLGNLEERHSVIEIRRSVSMDHSGRDRVSVADILRMNHDEEEGHVQYVEGCSIESPSSSKVVGKDGCRKGILHCVMSPVAMKRSISSGRFFLTRPSGHGRGRHNVIIPL